MWEISFPMLEGSKPGRVPIIPRGAGAQWPCEAPKRQAGATRATAWATSKSNDDLNRAWCHCNAKARNFYSWGARNPPRPGGESVRPAPLGLALSPRSSIPAGQTPR